MIPSVKRLQIQFSDGLARRIRSLPSCLLLDYDNATSDAVYHPPESEMPSEHVGRYEVEYFGVQLAQRQEWTAHVAIFGPSSNPMHRQCVFPDQRVCVEHTYPSREEAEEEARRYAYSVMKAEPHGR